MKEHKIEKRDIIALVFLACALILVVLALILREPETKKRSFYGTFDTVTTVYDYSTDTEDSFDAACELIESRLTFYHRLFDIYNEYDGVTNVATLNASAGGGAITVSEELFDFLEYCVYAHELSDGHVNVAMGSVLSLWHNAREDGTRIPTARELAEAGEHTDISVLVLDRERLTAEITDPHASLDVGAIAKGYAAERIAEELISENITSYVLDLGGNLRVIGDKPNGKGWIAGVQNPDRSSTDPYVYETVVRDSSVVTSGNYQRYYIVNGVRYHHIIDKDTLMPADHFSSVTVFCRDGGLADALSTALFCMSYEEGVALLSQLDSVSCVWVSVDGSVLKYGRE